MSLAKAAHRGIFVALMPLAVAFLVTEALVAAWRAASVSVRCDILTIVEWWRDGDGR